MSGYPADRRVKPTVGRPAALGSTTEIAQVLGIPEHTLEIWRSQGKGPKYLKVGRHVRYRWSDVNDWLATREVQNSRPA